MSKKKLLIWAVSFIVFISLIAVIEVKKNKAIAAEAYGEGFMGEIFITPYNYAPSGSAYCQGQILTIQQNTGLFTLLYNNFGGDGINTFGLPDIDRGQDISQGGNGLSVKPEPNIHYCIMLQGVYPSRN